MSKLSFKEKRTLQKTVAEKQAALRGGNLSFKEKREAQKLLRDALTKLGATSEPISVHATQYTAADLTKRSPLSHRFDGWGFAAVKPAEATRLLEIVGPRLSNETEANYFGRLAQAQRDNEIGGVGTEPAPGPASLFEPLLAGDYNSLSVPDFVGKIEEAYGEEEDLDKAKRAAIQYLEANRETLEAA